jgi:hypothetical protein
MIFTKWGHFRQCCILNVNKSNLQIKMVKDIKKNIQRRY